ncbi:MAG: CopD family protein [Saprospiraceae bacterium]|nr:CopD family protein [Saprospiraceae bacterium]
MLLPLFKSLHIVGFVAWFAGLFYLVRIFVYHVEALAKPQPERDVLARQFNIMEWRVYRIILGPAVVLTWACGTAMLFIYGTDWFQENWWMSIKLVLLVLLTGYHHSCKGIIRKLERGEVPFTSFQFRLLNEVPTLLLVPIVLLAVYRNDFNVWYTLAGILGFGGLLFAGAKLYKRSREK